MTIDQDTGEIITPFLRTAHNYDRNRASDESALVCADPSRTSQEFKDDSDINTIVERFGITGQLPDPGSVKAPLEGDFHEIYDFQSALNVVRAAEESFMQMPADVRAEFKNDPGRFVDFVNNPANRARAEELGIVLKHEQPKPPEPVLVKVVPEVSGGGTSST